MNTASTVPSEGPSWIENSVHRDKATRSVALQTPVRIPLRLRFLPSLADIIEENDPASANSKSSIIWKHIRFLGRLSLSQFGRNSNCSPLLFFFMHSNLMTNNTYVMHINYNFMKILHIIIEYFTFVFAPRSHYGRGGRVRCEESGGKKKYVLLVHILYPYISFARF